MASAQALTLQCHADERRFRLPGRKPLPDWQVLCGILFVLHTGIQWEYLPKELGFGSGMTCWRRLQDWNACKRWGLKYRPRWGPRLVLRPLTIGFSARLSWVLATERPTRRALRPRPRSTAAAPARRIR